MADARGAGTHEHAWQNLFDSPAMAAQAVWAGMSLARAAPFSSLSMSLPRGIQSRTFQATQRAHQSLPGAASACLLVEHESRILANLCERVM